MRVLISNPSDEKTHISPAEAHRLVYYGHASYVGEGQREIRYLTNPERHRIQNDMSVQLEAIGYERAIEIGRGGPITGEFWPTTIRTGKAMPGGPQTRAQQYEMTLEAIAEMNRKRKR